MLYVICGLLCAALIGLDQWVKWWTVTHIGGAAFEGAAFSGVWLSQPEPFIPHVLGLNFATNTGAAWSVLKDYTWILTILSTVVALIILYLLIRRKIRHPFGVIALTVVLAGAVGNLIDRIRLGYVVDMFQTLFMDFPIFNVADACVVCGGIAFCVYFVFFSDQWEKKS